MFICYGKVGDLLGMGNCTELVQRAVVGSKCVPIRSSAGWRQGQWEIIARLDSNLLTDYSELRIPPACT